ncbi:MAG: hypothetical protein EOO02_04155 [Chitinophagaceae bacterium]|nr:MAG: hypothetical protein EOO02_04155 [Chitinophagaceae bacterium]
MPANQTKKISASELINQKKFISDAKYVVASEVALSIVLDYADVETRRLRKSNFMLRLALFIVMCIALVGYLALTVSFDKWLKTQPAQINKGAVTGDSKANKR